MLYRVRSPQVKGQHQVNKPLRFVIPGTSLSHNNEIGLIVRRKQWNLACTLGLYSEVDGDGEPYRYLGI
jgi:hypothetical protein